LQKREIPYKRKVLGGIFRSKTQKTHFSGFWTKKAKKCDFLRSGALLSPKIAKSGKVGQNVKMEWASLECFVYKRFVRGTFCSKTLFCVFSILERKKRKSAQKTANSAQKRKIPHIPAFSRKRAQNTYKRHSVL
jgi:hypothetical protein